MRAIDHFLTKPMPLSRFRPLFANLAAPEPGDLPGMYRACFVGPAWLRLIAPRGLWLTGLGGWYGKRFDADGSGTNLVLRDDQVQARLPVYLVQQASAIDGGVVSAVVYPPHSPFPWMHVVDELRVLDATHLLGMTYVRRVTQRFPLPFVLTKLD